MSEPGPPVEFEEHAVALAGVGQRIGGALVDGLLTSMVVVVPILLGIVTVDDPQQGLPPGWAFALLIFGALYTVAPTALWGQTLGKVAVGTRVVTEADGSRPGWRRSSIRWGLVGLVGRIPYVGIFVSLVVTASLVLDVRRRGLHDKAAGTIVVRA
ncbi:MAG: RDD family protein [Actinomycetota bacterium]|nr:RDD family protein [Actinomycetota bacterium]